MLRYTALRRCKSCNHSSVHGDILFENDKCIETDFTGKFMTLDGTQKVELRKLRQNTIYLITLWQSYPS